MRRLLPLLLLLAAASSARAARAEAVILHIIPAAATLRTPEWGAELPGATGQIKVTRLFDASERAFLKAAGRPAYAETLKVTGIPEDRLEELARAWGARFRDATIERGARAELQSLGRDPLYPEQWALENTGQEVRVDLDDIRTHRLSSKPGEDLRLPGYLLENPPARDVRVAVLDTGVDRTHPDLAPRLRLKPEECKAWEEFRSCLNPERNNSAECLARIANPDRDGNGYPMDCAGWSVVDFLSPKDEVLGSPDSDDPLGHGTHVAGVIGAAAGNRIGIRGIAPNVTLIPVKVISATPNAPIRPQSLVTAGSEVPAPAERELRWPTASVDLVARGVLYAIRERADVINLSLGWPAALDSRLMREMIALARERGITVIAAAGNDATHALVQPCSYPEVICVGAHGPDGERAHYSNAGPGVDLFAPGTSILSTWPMSLRPAFYTDRRGYEFRTGTSMASPQVAGVFALLLSRGMPRDEILSSLVLGGRAFATGFGAPKVDVAGALAVSPGTTLIRPLQKAPIRLVWDHTSDEIAASVPLRNLRATVTDVRISARLDERSPLGLRDITLEPTHSGLAVWPAGEVREIPLRFRWTGRAVPREFWVELTVEIPGELPDRVLRIPVAFEVRPTVARVLRSFPLERQPIAGRPAGRDVQVRTVSVLDGGKLPLYLLASRTPEGRAFQLLLPDPATRGAYRLSAPQRPASEEGDLLLAQRYRSTAAGASRWALIFRKRNELLRTTTFRIEIFDDAFSERVRVIEYDNAYAPLPERFRWIRFQGRDALAFFARGFRPAPAKPDPWAIPDPAIELRLYVLDWEGALHELEAQKPYEPVLFLPETAEDRARDETAVLLVEGEDYALRYAIGHLDREGRMERITPFALSEFRNLRPLALSQILTEDGGVAPGWAASGPVMGGRLRVTRLFRDGYERMASDDFHFTPSAELDGITRLAGAFRLQGEAGAEDSFFTQTNWNLQFHDARSTATMSLGRFSFLPFSLFQRGYFPVILSSARASAMQRGHLPAMLIMDLGSGGLSMSLTYPEYDEDGKVTRLVSPALLQFESEAGCSWLGNPSWNDALRSTTLTALCGAELRTLQLETP